MRTAMEPIYVTVTEAAGLYGMHPRTISDAIRDRELKARRRGLRGHYRISKAELSRWFDRQHRPA